MVGNIIIMFYQQSIYGHNDPSSVATVTKKFLRSAVIATIENMNYSILSTCKLRPQILGYTNLSLLIIKI